MKWVSLVLSAALCLALLSSCNPQGDLTAPSNLVATATSSSRITLSWQDNSSGEEGFRIYRSTDSSSGFGTPLAEVAANASSYGDTGLSPQTTYYYRVAAYAGSNESIYASDQATTLDAGADALAAPSSLSATATSSSSIALSWQDNSSGEEGFRIYRSTDDSSGFDAPLTEVAADSSSYGDTGLSPQTTYYYRVTAYAGSEESTYASGQATTPEAPTSAPVAPSDATALTVGDSSMRLSWTDNSDNEAGFYVYRSASSSSGLDTPYAAVAANTTSQDVLSLQAGTTYYFRVTAYNAAGESDYASASGATTALDAPTLTGPSSATATFTLTCTYDGWGGLGSTNDRISLERSTLPDQGFAVANASPLGEEPSSYDFAETPPADGTYYYRARVYNTTSWTSYSPVKSVIYAVPSQSSTTFTPSSDNLLMASTDDSSYENTVYQSAYLAVGQQFAVGYEYTSCLSTMSALRFSTSELTGKTIIAAELRLYVSMLAADFETSYRLGAIGQSWSSSSITYANQPPIYDSLRQDFDPPTTWVVPVTLDVTDIVQNWANGSWANYGFMLWDPSFDYPESTAYRATEFYSVEADSSVQPQLYVEYQ